jgi:glycosyltransferase involved in cell wall biosynthesis
MEQRVFIVIPAHNEQKYIYDIVTAAKKFSENVIVVDDGSKDNTGDMAKKAKAVVLRHIINLGKGAALKTGCDYALKHGCSAIIAMDADAQHNPKQIPKFLESIKNHDVVLAYRQLDNKMPFILRFGNRFINKTISFLYGIKIRDSQCGYRAFTADAYRKIRWKANDYSMESEMIAKIGKYKLSYAEIPIETIYADKYKGTTVIDGIKIVFNLLFWKLNHI